MRRACLDIAIAKSIVSMLNRDARFYPADAEESRRALSQDEIDLIVGMPYGVERDRLFDFTPPYATVQHTVFAHSDAPRISSAEDLREATLAVIRGSLMHDFALEQGSTDRLEIVGDPTEGIRGLIEGRFQYLLMARIPGVYWIDRLGLESICVVGPNLRSAKLCLAVRKGNVDLQAELTEGLEILRSSGEYREIGDRWLGPSDPEQWSCWSLPEHALYVFVPLTLILGEIGLWNWSLRKTVARRTADLNRELMERKRAEAAVKESEAVARALLRAPTDSVFLISSDLTVLDCNETAEKNLGINREDIVGRSGDELLAEPIASIRENEAREVFETGLPRRFEDNRSGRWFDHVFYPIFDGQGKVTAVATISRDITARKRAEEKLRESEARFRTLVDSARDAIFIKDTDLVYTLVNPSMEELFQRGSDEFIGATDVDLFGQEAADHMEQVDRRVLRGEVISERHTRPINGVQHTFDVVKVPMRNAAGNIYGLCGIARDVTETIRLQRFTEQAKRLETAGRIAGQVAHDFNNLLGPLLAHPDLIREQLPAGSSLLPLLDDIEKSAEQMADINQQLLTLGRRGHYNQDPLDLNALVQQVMDRLDYDPRTVSIHMHLGQGLLPIPGGPSQIHRAVSNLVTNAPEALDGVGSINISTCNMYLDQDRAGFERIPRGEYVNLRLRDTGIGIPADILSRVFDPFFTTKRADRSRGSGLGLSVVHSVVKDHGGCSLGSR